MSTQGMASQSYNFESSGYKYPSLHREADEMMNLSIMIYTLVEIRNLLKLCPEKWAHPLLNVSPEQPLPISAALQIVMEEKETLEKNLSDGNHEATLNALQGIVDRCKRKHGEQQHSDSGGRSAPTLVHVGDEKQEKELVYAVGINPDEKRITVAFRGSTTWKDWKTDANVLTKDVGMMNTKDSISIHKGFHDYLFCPGENNISKKDEIMSIVNKLLDSPDIDNDNQPRREKYQVYVTGHSLGGALSTLFGFCAAASSTFPGPVTVVSVASPRVGNEFFGKAFALLESTGKVRHLRIANDRDMVTLGPTRILNLTTGSGYYVHTGIKMTLLNDDDDCDGKDEAGDKGILALSVAISSASIDMVRFKYSGASSRQEQDPIEKCTTGIGLVDSTKRTGMRSLKSTKKSMPRASTILSPVATLKRGVVKVSNRHYGSEYMERLANIEHDLEGKTLNGCYLDIYTASSVVKISDPSPTGGNITKMKSLPSPLSHTFGRRGRAAAAAMMSFPDVPSSLSRMVVRRSR